MLRRHREEHDKNVETLVSRNPQVPVVEAYTVRRGVFGVWCQYCTKYHYHGMGLYDRPEEEDCPHRKLGYIMRYAGPWRFRPFTRRGEPRRLAKAD